MATTLTAEDIDAIAEAVVRKQRSASASAIAAVAVTKPLTCAEFGARVGRGVDWVQKRCRARIIRPLPGSRPYLIPPSELSRFLDTERRRP